MRPTHQRRPVMAPSWQDEAGRVDKGATHSVGESKPSSRARMTTISRSTEVSALSPSRTLPYDKTQFNRLRLQRSRSSFSAHERSSPQVARARCAPGSQPKARQSTSLRERGPAASELATERAFLVVPQRAGELGSWRYRANLREWGRQAVNQQAETDVVAVFGSADMRSSRRLSGEAGLPDGTRWY